MTNCIWTEMANPTDSLIPISYILYCDEMQCSHNVMKVKHRYAAYMQQLPNVNMNLL